MEEEDEYKKIYEKFKACVDNDAATSFFDETELIDVFDYAGDVFDDRIRLEVLITAMRLYPKSDELLKRKAINLMDRDFSSFVEFMETAPVDSSAIWQILKARADYNEKTSAIQLVEELLAKIEFNQDEEVIQFVSLIKFLDGMHWLLEHIDDVRKLCKYDDTMLLYEVARQCDTPQMMNLALHLLDELTLKEPFNINYWNLKAEFSYNNDDFEEAQGAVDYVLALSPDDPFALTVEAQLLQQKGDVKGAIIALEKITETDSVNTYFARLQLVRLYKVAGKLDKAREIAFKLSAEFPSDIECMMELLMLSPNDCDDILSRYYSMEDIKESDEDIIGRASTFVFMRMPRLALNYIRWHSSRMELSEHTRCAFLEVLYMNGYYDEAMDYLQNDFVQATITPAEISVLVIIVSTLLRSGKFTTAQQFCGQWLKEIDNLIFPNLSGQMAAMGVKFKLYQYAELLAKDPNPTEEALSAILI